ncbi:MAG: enoyl-CoA hydratase [Actinomycetes bacterium]
MPVHVERRGRVEVITIDDAERRNVLSDELVAGIVSAIDAAESDDGIGALVITGAGRAFCAGADLSDLAAMGNGEREPGSVVGVYEGFLRVLRSPLPTVAAVNGPAVGAGFNLALAADLRIAGESARFDARFLQIGIHPGGGHTWLLDRAVGPQAAAAIDLFGARLDGAAAARIGLAWECVPDAELLDRAVEHAGRAADAPRELAIRTKATLRRAHATAEHDTALENELRDQVWSFGQPWFAERTGR